MLLLFLLVQMSRQWHYYCFLPFNASLHLFWFCSLSWYLLHALDTIGRHDNSTGHLAFLPRSCITWVTSMSCRYSISVLLALSQALLKMQNLPRITQKEPPEKTFPDIDWSANYVSFFYLLLKSFHFITIFGWWKWKLWFHNFQKCLIIMLATIHF